MHGASWGDLSRVSVLYGSVKVFVGERFAAWAGLDC